MKKITIKNFQSHEDTSIELCDGVNVFTGNSDCGKSAILRALIWGITNQPTGDFFVSNWVRDAKGKVKGECSVAIDDVKRVRGADVNEYQLNGGDNTGIFEALRGEVPETVSKKLNLGSVNIQRQFDGPFMLSNTPGENARYINELVNLTDIDDALSWVGSQQRICTSDIKVATSQIEKIEKEIRDPNRIKQLIEDIEKCDKLSETISYLEDRINAISDAIRNFNTLQSSILEDSTLGSDIDRLGSLLERGRGLSGEYNTLQQELQNFDRERRMAEMPDVDIRRVQRADTLVRNIFDEIRDTTDSLEEFLKETHNLESSNNKLEEIRKELSTMTCPLCGHRGYHND